MAFLSDARLRSTPSRSRMSWDDIGEPTTDKIAAARSPTDWTRVKT